MDKNEVRQLIMNRRHELSDEDIEMQSELIIDRLKKSDIYKTSENVFLYMSYNREVDTFSVITHIQKHIFRRLIYVRFLQSVNYKSALYFNIFIS